MQLPCPPALSAPSPACPQATIDAAVLQMAWVGSSIVLVIPGGYAVMRQGARAGAAPGMPLGTPAHPQWTATVLADHLTVFPMVGAVPPVQLAVLAWDEGMLLLTDEDGTAVRAPLVLGTQPLALAAAGLFVVAVCDDGLHVFDR
jgi:hypothetical protein